MSLTITLPWPPSELTPNSRLGWRAKHSATKAYRAQCWSLALGAGLHRMVWPQEIPIKITLCDPTGRVKRDDDNAKAAFKAGRDGVAQAMRVDDARWRPEYITGAPVKGGAVILEFPSLLVPLRGVIS